MAVASAGPYANLHLFFVIVNFCNDLDLSAILSLVLSHLHRSDLLCVRGMCFIAFIAYFDY